MVKMKLNLDQSGGNFDPIPQGEYPAYLSNVEFKTFRSGNVGFNLEFTVAEGQYRGRKVFDNLVFVESAGWKLAQFWKAMTGLSGEVEINTEDVPKFVGKKAVIKVDVDSYESNGGEERERNVVKQIKPYLGTQNEDLLDSFMSQPAGAFSDPDLPF